jgi:hypothetical protein
MKKIITLVLAVASFAAANAQTTKEEARRVILGESKGSTKTTPTQSPRDIILGGGNNGGVNSGSREAQIEQVNREYDAKIQSVRNNPYLSQAEKDRAIRQLESDRARKIREINGQYSSNKKYSKKNRKDYDRDEARHDNGKHLGWEKGKGNPHKNGGKPKGKKG